MKTILTYALTAFFCLTATGHERLTIGPGGGRLIMLDSVVTPNAEVSVKGGNAVVELLDVERRVIELKGQSLGVIAGDRANPTRLKGEIVDNQFVAGPLPAGDDYYVVFRLKEAVGSKAITFRLHYQTAVCEACERVEWLCVCGNVGTGEEIEVPETIAGLWAELNQHHAELKEGYAEKAYEALDEVTDAFPILAAALPAKSEGLSLSAEQKDAVKAGALEVVAALAEVKAANAARKLEEAKGSVAKVAGAIALLKENFPKATAEATLEE